MSKIFCFLGHFQGYFSSNQRVPQKYSLEILMENYVMNQSKQLQELKNQTGFLNDSLSKLNTKVDSIANHTKMLETQISQVAQQVAASSQTPRVFPGQTEANPKAHVNAISFGGSKQLEDTIAKAENIEGECVKLLGEKAIIESEKSPDKTKVPFPLRLAKPNLEAQFNFFLICSRRFALIFPLRKFCLRCLYMLSFLKKFFQRKRQ